MWQRPGAILPAAMALATATAVGMGSVAAADFPSRPIEVVIPFAQGGGTDRVGRMFADHVQKHIGGETFVSNREGGSGAVGFSYGANARPDGHVITMAVTTLAVAPHTVAGYPVTYESFAPVCLLAALPMTVSVQADSPFETIDDLIEHATSNPGQLKIGAAGIATNNYLAGVAFAKEAGIEAQFIPYEGAGPALVALLGGHVEAAMADASEALPYAQGEQTRVLIVFGDEKVDHYPDAPTSAEKGLDVNVASFRGIAAPKDTPPDVLAALRDACEQTATDPEFIDEMGRFGMEVDLVKGEEFGDWLRGQHETYAEAAEAAGMTAD